jgi:hypothetical protein
MSGWHVSLGWGAGSGCNSSSGGIAAAGMQLWLDVGGISVSEKSAQAGWSVQARISGIGCDGISA